jgi:hypothetical protein
VDQSLLGSSSRTGQTGGGGGGSYSGVLLACSHDHLSLHSTVANGVRYLRSRSFSSSIRFLRG